MSMVEFEFVEKCLQSAVIIVGLTLTFGLACVWFIIRVSLKPVHLKLDALNGVDSKLFNAINAHGHRGLKGTANEVIRKVNE